MAKFLPNGLGDYPTGDSLAYAEPLQVSGNVWYVDPVSGTDAVSPRGLNESRPLLTLAQAITNAADHDIIVLLGANIEQTTTAITVSKAVTIVGAETQAGRPAYYLKRTGGASVNLLNITAAGVQLRNVLFQETGTSAVATDRIAVAAARFRMVGCYVESGEYDTGPAVNVGVGGAGAEFRNCQFVAIHASAQSAITVASAQTDVRIYSCTVDGGASGYSNTYALDFTAAAITRLECEGLSLLNGADMGVHASTVGWVHAERATGGAKVVW